MGKEGFIQEVRFDQDLKDEEINMVVCRDGKGILQRRNDMNKYAELGKQVQAEESNFTGAEFHGESLVKGEKKGQEWNGEVW